jgi:hypothetical protein
VIKGSIAAWRACFPRARCANVSRGEWEPDFRRASVVDADFTIAPEEAAVATAELEDAAFTAAPVEDAAAPDHGGNDEEKADDVGGQTNKKQRIEEKN